MLLKVDLHMHTYHSNGTQYERWPPFIAKRLIDSRMTIDEILNECQKKKIDVISITDHDEVEWSLEAVEKAKKRNILAIPGTEVTSGEGHILAYGIREKIPTKMGIVKTIEHIKNLGGIAVAAHPFSPQGVFFRKSPKRYEFDAIEVYSAAAGKIVPKAVSYADSNNLPKLSGSDAKASVILGLAYTIIEGEKTEKAVIDAICKGKTQPKCEKNINRIFLLKELIKSNYFRSN